MEGLDDCLNEAIREGRGKGEGASIAGVVETSQVAAVVSQVLRPFVLHLIARRSRDAVAV